MKRYKFTDLLSYDNRVKKLFFSYGLNFNSLNRISKYFQYLKEVEEARQLDSKSFAKLISKDKPRYYYSQYYVLEICNLIDSLDKQRQNKTIVKKKLTNISKGTFLLSEENPADTLARDTTFELSLFSFFQSRGLNIQLCEPNPDLKLISNKFIYEIECKRPQSMNSLEKNIKKAFKQLNRSNKTNVIPTIALCLDQVLFKRKDVILDSKDEITASNFLNVTLEVFLRNNIPMIQKIMKNKSYLVLYYLSCLVGFKTDIPMANATFITGNIYNFETSLSTSIFEDLNALIPQSSL